MVSKIMCLLGEKEVPAHFQAIAHSPYSIICIWPRQTLHFPLWNGPHRGMILNQNTYKKNFSVGHIAEFDSAGRVTAQNHVILATSLN
jgi:hypothetical protein